MIFDNKKSILTKGLNNKINLLIFIKIILKKLFSFILNELAAKKYTTKLPKKSTKTARYSNAVATLVFLAIVEQKIPVEISNTTNIKKLIASFIISITVIPPYKNSIAIIGNCDTKISIIDENRLRNFPATILFAVIFVVKSISSVPLCLSSLIAPDIKLGATNTSNTAGTNTTILKIF